MKTFRAIFLGVVLLCLSVSVAQAAQMSRGDFLDVLFKMMGISEQVSQDVAGLSDAGIFDFETEYLWNNYGSQSLRGVLGEEALKLGEFVEVSYQYLLTKNVGLERGAVGLSGIHLALTKLGIEFPEVGFDDVMDRDEILRILNSPLFADLKAEAYHSPADEPEGADPDRGDVLGAGGAGQDVLTRYTTRGLNVGEEENNDTDGDGVPDLDEIARGTDYTNPDTDGDGTNDLDDSSYGWPAALDGNNDGISDKREGWGWELGIGPDKEQITDLKTVSDTFWDNAGNNGFNWYARADKLVWDATQGDGVNDIPAGFDRAEVRQLVKEQLREDIQDVTTSNNYRKYDVVMTKIADAQSGKVLTDIYGNRVRVDQYILRPDSDTIQLLNITLRGNNVKGGNISGVSTLEWKIDFNTSLNSLPSGGLKTLPWDEYLSKKPTYTTEPNYYPENSSITLARNNSRAMENRGFEALVQKGAQWTQKTTDTTLSLNVGGIDIGVYKYSDMLAGHIGIPNGWLWEYSSFTDTAKIATQIYNIDKNGNPLTPPDMWDNLSDMHSSLRYSLNLANGYTQWHCTFGKPGNSDNADVITVPMSGFAWNDISYSE